MSVNGGLTTAANLISVYSATSLQMTWVSSVICIAISGKFSAKNSGVWPNLRQLNFDAPELKKSAFDLTGVKTDDPATSMGGGQGYTSGVIDNTNYQGSSDENQAAKRP